MIFESPAKKLSFPFKKRSFPAVKYECFPVSSFELNSLNLAAHRPFHRFRSFVSRPLRGGGRFRGKFSAAVAFVFGQDLRSRRAGAVIGAVYAPALSRSRFDQKRAFAADVRNDDLQIDRACPLRLVCLRGAVLSSARPPQAFQKRRGVLGNAARPAFVRRKLIRRTGILV